MSNTTGKVAWCAPGRKAITEAGLRAGASLDDCEVREHPCLHGSEAAYVTDDPDKGWLYEPEPVPWPLPEPVRCPGCTASIYPGCADASSHYSFCWIFNPPPGPIITGLPAV